jgi:hypothetical protein
MFCSVVAGKKTWCFFPARKAQDVCWEVVNSQNTKRQTPSPQDHWIGPFSIGLFFRPFPLATVSPYVPPFLSFFKIPKFPLSLFWVISFLWISKRWAGLGLGTYFPAPLVQFGGRGEWEQNSSRYRTSTILSSFDDIKINGQWWDHRPP